MKNIYTLPTDKPSKLFTNMNDELSLLGRYSEYKGFISNQNIYITSDEKIKRGDCILLPNNEIIVLPTGLSQVPLNNFIRGYSLSDCKKIILTTDQDLIKDGVQAIDDEFLQWFVAHPSCEEVKIEFETLWLNKRFGGTWQPFPDEQATEKKKGYKIIIPKEEPKQDWYCPKCQSYISSESVTFEETHQLCNTSVIILEPKQETLEEVGEKYSKKSSSSIFQESHKKDFINGAKWQAERMYSEEDLEKAYKDGGRNEYDFINKYHCKARISFDKWFEKFKKK